ncbi:hypothetical protein D3C78_1773270 [compost metagenome]
MAAPCFFSAVAAWHRVPAVSTMSSTRMQVRPSTSPMMCITSDWLAFGRRLSMIARSTPRLLATARARTTPPMSGETIIRFSKRWAWMSSTRVGEP